MEVSGSAAALSPLAFPLSVPTSIKLKTTSSPFIFPFTSTSTSLHLQMLFGGRSGPIMRGVGVLCLLGPPPASDNDWKLIRSIPIRRRRGVGGVICLAGPDAASELSHDAPFAIAIAASILHSLLFPLTPPSSQQDEDDLNVKFPVMAIISLIPFFNWLSWVFAFMDTGNRRYAVYAAVYLAPYLSTNLSLSPDESWLPIASIVLCIIHIQLEASIRSGDLDTFAFFHEAAVRFGLVAKSKDNHSRTQSKLNKERSTKLPSSQSQRREWEDHKKSSREAKHGIEDSDLDDGTDHH